MSKTAHQPDTEASETVVELATAPDRAQDAAPDTPSDAVTETARAKDAAVEEEPEGSSAKDAVSEPKPEDGSAKAETVGESGKTKDTETESDAAEGGGGKRRVRVPRIDLDGRFTAVAVLLALTASIVAAAFLWRSYDAASGELAEQQRVRTSSAEFARAFLLYQKDDLDGWEERLTALAVPDYKGPISQAVKAQFPVITELGASSRVSVREVFVNEFDGPVAKTMVVADTQITSAEFVRTVTGMRLLVELERQNDGRWLISGIGVLGMDDEAVTDPKGNPVDLADVEVPAAPGTGE
ncbi:hypothetical protein LO762_09985 [Actinocorallia sp. API 0066]|uniref:hypothetical protein n=1 Tax=Actinocorallia sp. API 0066 TaxID=2896846 RepID=UPI001E32EBF8|nr:hypothetical protein [Actinocorallia sp. API 0066]MCD0449519.1 hypothetical protein [Actinocorallia sp. API 0066]